MAKAKQSSGKQSLADLWDGTDASEASNNLPSGEHTVRVNSIELKEDKKNGTAAIINYECIDGDEEGKKARQLYKLTDSAGGKGPGMAYLVRDLALMGYDKIDGKKLKKTLEEITEEQPMVVINAKENGQYVNAYLQGLAEEAVGKDDEGDGDGDAEELAEGDKVEGKDDDGDDVTGTIKKISKKKGTATVVDEDDEEHTCDLSDLTKVDEEEEEEKKEESEGEIEEDSEVTFEDPDDEDETLEGTVVEINGKKAVVKVGKKKYTVKVADLTLKEEEGAEPEEIEEGDEVSFEDDDGDTIEGTVKKIKGDMATVEDEDGDKHKVKVEDLTKQD